MKNSMKYVAISIVMIFVVLFFTMVRSNASGSSIIITNQPNTNNTTNTTNTTNTPTNTNAAPVNNAAEKENVVNVNQINDAEKDLPQTGETDVYIIAGIAVITVAVGALTFIKSRKYDI